MSFFVLDPAHTDPARVKKERERARELRKSSWWRGVLQKGLCGYCGERFSPEALTMDHVVPLARGGRSTRGNLVPACGPCNQSKKLETPVDQLFAQLEAERKTREQGEGSGSRN